MNDMDITLYISRFIYRIRYQIIIGSLVVAGLVAYFTQFLPKTYTVNTSIYTGIVSTTGLDDEKLNYFEQNNTFDNLINLTKAKGTLENVSLKLFATSMVHGNPDEDNTYITAKNYSALKKTVPKEVLELIDRSSLSNTIKNLVQYKEDVPRNFLFDLFNYVHPHYSYNALKNVVVARKGNSDLVEISYSTNDPGIALNAVKYINEELINSYESIRYKSANDIVSYYEEQLKLEQIKLNGLENNLTSYNIENQVINYGEQTKAIAIAHANYEDRYEQTIRDLESSNNLLKELEAQMDTRTKLIKTNTDFIDVLNEVSTINGKITEIEAFNSETSQSANAQLEKYRQSLKIAESKLVGLSNNMTEYKLSKEGVAIGDMVNQWLTEMIRNTKAKAELKVLKERNTDFKNKYKILSPVGTQINRKEREIRVSEESYLEILHGLNLAKLKQKNIRLTSASLNVITLPAFPLMSDSSKRGLLTVAAFMGSIIFIIGFNLVIELLDRTLRDADRARRLTQTPIFGAFTGNNQLKYRGYIKMCNRVSAAHTCNRLNRFLHNGKPTYINILSIENKEGKSFIIKYLKEQWEEQGLKVVCLVAEKDFSADSSFLLANNFDYFRIENNIDIVIVEHLSLQRNIIPSGLLKRADINLLIANACRVWKNSDDEYLKYLKEMKEDAPLYMYLNNARREAVEDFTGPLPPKSSMQDFANRVMYLGLTARNSAVKE